MNRPIHIPRVFPRSAWASALSLAIVVHAEETKPVIRQPLPSAEEIARLPPDGGPEFNRLVFATSPYLRQHARNPVDWHPWGDEAFALARKENKPVFLSVGYSACHWCHVMEHESFEDEQVAEILNRHFVSIKVDREERPDVDQIYMNATQALTGRGGWPNSVFLDLDRRPFFAGTYFPRKDRDGQAGFVTILLKLAEIWKTQPEAIAQTAETVEKEIQRLASLTNQVAAAAVDARVIAAAVAAHSREFDGEHGGFGGAPKFPPHAALGLLLALREKAGGDLVIDRMIARTLDAMALGGLHDHVGGGFHRYATDAIWFLPHFEKMLYDNAQLARVYARAAAAFTNAAWRAVAEDTLDWCLRDLRHPDGGFYSAYDADSEGEEGKFYLWTLSEVESVLGAEAPAFTKAYAITAEGNYYDEATGRRSPRCIPHLKAFPSPLDSQRGALGRLREARAKRVPPGLDDKVIASWNGMMIGALATAGRLLERPDYTREAEKTASFMLKRMRSDGILARSWRAGQTGGEGFLEDYAYLALGLLDLHQATGNPSWLSEVKALAETIDREFRDEKGGGYFFTAHRQEKLLARNKEAFDNATPAPNGIVAQVFARLAAVEPKADWAARARRQVDAFGGLAAKAPSAMSSYLEAAVLIPATARQPARLGPVLAEARLEGSGTGAAKSGVLRLTVDAGFHLNANPPSLDYLIPLELGLPDGAPGKLDPIRYPPGKPFRIEGEASPISVYEGTLEIPFTLRPPDGAAWPDDLALTVRFQACDEKGCLKPETLRVPVRGP